MKTMTKLVAVLFIVGLLGSSCATVDRYSTEAEEEATRVQQMTPQEKAAWENEQHEEYKVELKGYFDDGDSE